MTTIHDAPLTNYPRLIATLIRQRTLKIVKREPQRKASSLSKSLRPTSGPWPKPMSRAIGPSLSASRTIRFSPTARSFQR